MDIQQDTTLWDAFPSPRSWQKWMCPVGALIEGRQIVDSGKAAGSDRNDLLCVERDVSSCLFYLFSAAARKNSLPLRKLMVLSLSRPTSGRLWAI